MSDPSIPRWPSWSSQAGTRSSSSNTPKSIFNGNRKQAFCETRKVNSTIYTKTNFEQIATVIGAAVKPVADLEAQVRSCCPCGFD